MPIHGDSQTQNCMITTKFHPNSEVINTHSYYNFKLKKIEN